MTPLKIYLSPNHSIASTSGGDAEGVGWRFQDCCGSEDHTKPLVVSTAKLPSSSSGQLKLEDIDQNLMRFNGPDDMDDPQNWSRNYKWFVTMICAFMTVNVTFASSAPTASTQLIAEKFGVTLEVANLLTSLFLLGYVAGPILWGPGSEVFGRRPVFIVTMTCYTLFILGQALARNTATLLITRFFSGFFACAPLTNAAGLIADIWDPILRGPATSIFVMMVFLGPVLGPVVGGFIAQETGDFRWVFWVMFIFAAVASTLAIAFVPETYAPRILELRARRLRAEDPVNNQHLYAEAERHGLDITSFMDRTIKRPFVMLAVEPILLLITIYISVLYGILYGLFEAVPIVFSIKHDFTVAQSGLTFIGVGVGVILSCAIAIHKSRMYGALVKEWRGHPPPENRLQGAMVAAPVMVIGVFWFGWTGNYPNVHWAAPAVSLVLVGFSVTLIFISFVSYLVDTYLMHAASALAANTIVRSAIAAAFPLFTTQMYERMGVQWASTLIGLIALVLAPIPFLFFKYGARIRRRSQFAPCADLKLVEVSAQTLGSVKIAMVELPHRSAVGASV
ncbi:unnamed protein product [Peniophora sp. CBMAI 1063]|nr:unnamed protein product [Peniophora sp. CBMAI 1063]